jgi:hypothetical protein
MRPVKPAAAFQRPELRGEQKDVAFAGLQYDGFRLRAGHLFREHEFPARVVFPGFVQEKDGLDGEVHIAVQILVQGIETTCPILKD